jgi:hypothetical protein
MYTMSYALLSNQAPGIACCNSVAVHTHTSADW